MDRKTQEQWTDPKERREKAIELIRTGEAADTKVKVIFCFLIAPGHRGKGIAQSLLDRVCEDAAGDGYAYIEVYPFADEKFEFPYHGTFKMYEKNGFAEVANLEYVKVMRKML